MTTITISLDEKLADEFRAYVKKNIGNTKGVLKTVISEAITNWLNEKKQEKIARELKELMRKGYKTGGITYKDRDELYER